MWFFFSELEYSLLNASLKEKKSFLKMAGGGGLIMYKELECLFFKYSIMEKFVVQSRTSLWRKNNIQ